MSFTLVEEADEEALPDKLGPAAVAVELSLAEIVGGGGIGGRPFGKLTVGTAAAPEVAPPAPTTPLELATLDLGNAAVVEDCAPRNAPPLDEAALLDEAFIESGGADTRLPPFVATDVLWSPEALDDAVASIDSGRRGGNRSFILSSTLASSKPIQREFGVKPKRAAPLKIMWLPEETLNQYITPYAYYLQKLKYLQLLRESRPPDNTPSGRAPVGVSPLS